MPDGHRTQPVVQQHDHGVTRRNLTQQVIEARRQLVRNPAMAARRGQHFDLQAALARRQVHAFGEIVRSDVHACVDQCGRQRRRAALVVELRIKRHRGDFGLPRDPRRPGVAQSHGLRHHRCATAQCRQQQHNAGAAARPQTAGLPMDHRDCAGSCDRPLRGRALVNAGTRSTRYRKRSPAPKSLFRHRRRPGARLPARQAC